MRLGVSMRITESDSYIESRNTIAQDWCAFFDKEFSNDQYLFIPNMGESVKAYVSDWGIDMIFLSGGEDIGTNESRDETEIELINYALSFEIPLIGVCRGMQMINQFFGGESSLGDEDFEKRHIATKHEVCFRNDIRMVNSYHSRKITESSLGENLNILGFDPKDHTVEALGYKNLLAVMWHPEREQITQESTMDIIKKHISAYGK